ncbi:MAG TPA: type II toxin-antitoxin system RelE/ParE family toxin [Ignavibacteria bacterium]|nr:type II toxin-antitoxin system RelE/ParE family toxin [Ignavibacteria bacterium]HMR42005.1 type II toxin-antitoxin system RelE/ParE family toxin [Ignavibacteria bacterium]
MKYDVQFTKDAENDIFGLYEYIKSNDSIDMAEKLIDRLIQKCSDLDIFPNRGHILPELEYLQRKDYLEIHYKSYRIIYRIIEKVVFVNCILDGRRDLNELLHKRLLR